MFLALQGHMHRPFYSSYVICPMTTIHHHRTKLMQLAEEGERMGLPRPPELEIGY